MTRSHPPRRTTIATVTDEIGIEFGVYGEWRLRAEFTPVYASAGINLRAVAMKGRVSPHLHGDVCEPRVFRQAVLARDRPMVASLAVALCLRNLQNTFLDGLKLVVAADPALAARETLLKAAARTLGREIEGVGLPPDDVIVDLTPLGETGMLRDAALALRSRMIRFALVEAGEGTALREGVPRPDLVVIAAEWFESICAQPATTHLFRTLVQGYRTRGSIVLIEGVRSAAALRLALEAGADWLCGELLAEEAPAGALFPEASLPLRTLLDERRVIKLSR